jgi:hypothetical protein
MNITDLRSRHAPVDTIGQSVYALWTVDASSKWVTGGGLIALLMPLLQKLLPLVTGSGDPTTKAWVRIPMSGLAFVAGVALFVAVASVWSALTHGLIWFGERPVGDPGCRMILPREAEQRDVTLDAARRIVVAKVPSGEECQDGAEPLGLASWAGSRPCGLSIFRAPRRLHQPVFAAALLRPADALLRARVRRTRTSSATSATRRAPMTSRSTRITTRIRSRPCTSST